MSVSDGPPPETPSHTQEAPDTENAISDYGQGKDLIERLESFRPYNPLQEAIASEIWAMRAIWGSLVVVVVGLMLVLGCIFIDRRLNYSNWFWVETSNQITTIMAWFGGILSLAYPLLFIVRFKHRGEDRARHISGEFKHRTKQVGELAAFPISVLESVNRFYMNRPVGILGFMGSLVGSGVVTLTTIGAVAGIGKLMVDAKPGSGTHSGAATLLGTLLIFLGAVAAIARYSLSQSDYRRTLLADAVETAHASSLIDD